MNRKAYKHEWYLKNKERCKENNKRYKKEHSEKQKSRGGSITRSTAMTNLHTQKNGRKLMQNT